MGQGNRGWRTDGSFGDLIEGRSNNLDLMRVVFAVGVVLFHSFLFTTVSGNDPLEWLTGGTANLGGESVSAFFAISGLLITASWLRRPEVGSFMTSRVLRIYPAFLVVYAFCLLVVGPLGATDVGRYFSALSPARVVFDALTLGRIEPVQAYQDLPNVAGELNSSLWTIRIEFFCYLLALALGVFGLLRRPRVVVALFAAAFAARFLVHVASLLDAVPSSARVAAYGDHVDLLAFFLAGACFYVFRAHIPRSRTLAVGAVLVWLAAALLHELWAVSPIVFTYLIFYVGYTPRAALQGLQPSGGPVVRHLPVRLARPAPRVRVRQRPPAALRLPRRLHAAGAAPGGDQLGARREAGAVAQAEAPAHRTADRHGGPVARQRPGPRRSARRLSEFDLSDDLAAMMWPAPHRRVTPTPPTPTSMNRSRHTTTVFGYVPNDFAVERTD